MDPASATATASPASTWRRSVRRRSLGGAGAQAAKEGIGRRAEELEEAVWRLRAEKDAAEDAAAALRAELDAERGAAETAASEAMLMIARLQREKAAAMMEARELRGLAEGRAGRDRDLQDRLAVVSALAASYAAILRAHGIDPDDDKDDENYDQEQEESAIERIEAGVEEDGENRGGDLVAKGAVVEEPSPPPPPAAKEYEYTIDVIRTAATKAAATAAGEERKRAVVDVAGGLGLYARVAALEADSAALRREVAALRAERAQVVLAREVARRLCWEAASARAVVATEERPRFSVLAICKWLFSTILWGKTRSASASTTSSSSSSSTSLPVLGQLVLLLERSNGDHRIQSSQMAASGEKTGLACCERPWCSPL